MITVTIRLTGDLARYIQEQADHNGVSVDEIACGLLETVVNGSSKSSDATPGSEIDGETRAGTLISERFARIMSAVPAHELARLPTDLSDKLDDYLYSGAAPDK